MKHNWANHNPVKGVTIPSDADAVRMHILTASEEKLYFATALSQFEIEREGKVSHHGPFVELHDVARLILLQGCRPEEVLRLRPSDVDLERCTMRVERGKSRAARRTLRLRPKSRDIIAARLGKTAKWIFPGRVPGEAQQN
jgi:integrase